MIRIVCACGLIRLFPRYLVGEQLPCPRCLRETLITEPEDNEA